MRCCRPTLRLVGDAHGGKGAALATAGAPSWSPSFSDAGSVSGVSAPSHGVADPPRHPKAEGFVCQETGSDGFAFARFLCLAWVLECASAEWNS